MFNVNPAVVVPEPIQIMAMSFKKWFNCYKSEPLTQSFYVIRLVFESEKENKVLQPTIKADEL